jgi:hypothetical protein
VSRVPWILGIAALALAGLLAWLLITPSRDRTWAPDQAKTATAEIAGSVVTIRNVRDFAWRPDSSFTARWEERRYDLRQLDSAWLVVAPFSTRWRGPAHTFVSFGFGDSAYLAISVEARREAGEEYGLAKGLFRRFELAYIVGDERDLIGKRVIADRSEVFLYPLVAGPEKLRTVFTQMLERATRLAEHPEFYNTFTNNCTSNLIGHANVVADRHIPSGLATLLPGYADQVALSLGLIDSTGGIAQVRARFRITDRARAAIDRPDFSRAIRAAPTPP